MSTCLPSGGLASGGLASGERGRVVGVRAAGPTDLVVANPTPIGQHGTMLPTVARQRERGDFRPLEDPPKDPVDRELCRSFINSAFFPDGKRPPIITASIQKKRFDLMMASERRRLGLAACTTAEEVLQVGRVRDEEASRLRHEIHVLDVRRSRIDPPTCETIERWTQAYNQIQARRMKLLELVCEAPVGMARNRGAGGRPATWASALFVWTQAIAHALDEEPATVLRALFAHLENNDRTQAFVRQMLGRFRQWRHRQRERASPRSKPS